MNSPSTDVHQRWNRTRWRPTGAVDPGPGCCEIIGCLCGLMGFNWILVGIYTILMLVLWNLMECSSWDLTGIKKGCKGMFYWTWGSSLEYEYHVSILTVNGEMIRMGIPQRWPKKNTKCIGQRCPVHGLRTGRVRRHLSRVDPAAMKHSENDPFIDDSHGRLYVLIVIDDSNRW